MNGGTGSLYFQRDAERILESIYGGRGCIVVGSVKRGKSQLLRTVRVTLQHSRRHAVIYHKLTEPNIRLHSSAQFFNSLWRSVPSHLKHKAGIVNPNTVTRQRRQRIKTSAEYAHLLASIAQHSTKDIVYIVDNPQSIPPNLIVDLLTVLSDVIEKTLLTGARARFIVVISGTIELDRIAEEQIKALEPHITRIELDDLTRDEAMALVEARCEDIGIAPRKEGIAALLAHTGHDYYLIDQVMKTCGDLLTDDAHERYLTPVLVQRSLEAFVARFDPTDVLSRYFQRSKEMLDVAVRFLTTEGDTSVPLSSARNSFSPLLSGLFKQDGEKIRIKCLLWETLLKAHLTPLTIGRYYVLHREWHAALDYLGRAYRDVLESQYDSTTPLIYEELRAAIFKAMYASEIPPATEYKPHGPIVRPQRAIEYMLRGLAILYPQSQPHLYIDGGQEVYPISTPYKRISQALYDTAINKAEYSIIQRDDDRYSMLFIPMELGEGERRYRGLLTLRMPFSEQPNVYKTWAQHQALVALIHEAAAVLTVKQHEIESLIRALKFSEKTNDMFETLGVMLHQKTLNEDLLLKLACHAISAGVGLGFNRVIFLMKSHSTYNNEVLRVTRAIGHLTYHEARPDWENVRHTFRDLEALRLHVLENDGTNWVQTPLAKALGAYEVPIMPNTIQVVGAIEKNIVKVFNDGKPHWHKLTKPPRDRQPTTLTKALGLRREYILLPLIASDGTSLGVVYADYALIDKPITKEIITLATTFVRQVALAIENMRSLKTKEAETDSLKALLDALQKTTQDRTNESPTGGGGQQSRVETIVERIVAEMQEWLHAHSVVIYSVGSLLLREEENFVKVAPPYIEVERADKLDDSGTIRGMVRRLNPLRIDNVDVKPAQLTDEEYTDIRSSTFIEKHHIRCFVGLPLGESDEDLGVLYVNWTTPYQLNEFTMNLLKVYSAFAAEAIRRAYYTQRTEERMDEMLKVLNNPPSDEEAELTGVRESAYRGLRRLAGQLKASRLSLYLTEPNNQWRVFTYPNGIDSQEDTLLQYEQLPYTVSEAFSAGGTDHRTDKDSIAKPLEFERNCVAVLYLESYNRNEINRLAKKGDISEDFLSFRQNLGRLDAARLYQAQRDILQQLSPAQTFTDDSAISALLQNLTQIMMMPGRMVDAISLYVIERGELILRGLVGFEKADEHRRTWQDSQKFIRSLMRDDHDIITHEDEPELLRNNKVAEREDFTACAVVPLRVNGKGVGCVFFNYRFPHQFSEAEKQQMLVLGAFAASAIYQAILARMIKQLSEFARRINASLKSEVVFRTLLEQARELSGAEHVAIVEQKSPYELTIAPVNFEEYAPGKPFYRVEDTAEFLPDKTYVARIAKVDALGQPQDVSTATLAGLVISSQKWAYIPDVQTEQHLPYFAANPHTRSNLAIPIIRDNQCSAALVLESSETDVFTEQDITLVSQLANHAGIAISNARQSEKMAFSLMHDLQQDISSLSDKLRAMENQYTTDPEIQDHMRIAQRYVVEMNDTLTAMEHVKNKGRLKAPSDTFKVSQIIDDVLNHVTYHKPQEARMALKRQEPPDAKIMCDRILLKHVLANIIYNAFDAIQARYGFYAIQGVVRIATHVRASEVFIRITDNGTGIVRSAEKYDHIFTDGYTTRKKPRKMAGYGLSLCDAVIRTQHSGNIKVISRQNNGTCFLITLPLM